AAVHGMDDEITLANMLIANLFFRQGEPVCTTVASKCHLSIAKCSDDFIVFLHISFLVVQHKLSFGNVPVCRYPFDPFETHSLTSWKRARIDSRTLSISESSSSSVGISSGL